MKFKKGHHSLRAASCFLEERGSQSGEKRRRLKHLPREKLKIYPTVFYFVFQAAKSLGEPQIN